MNNKLNISIIGQRYRHDKLNLTIEVVDIANNGLTAICRVIPLISGLDTKVKRIGRKIFLEDYTQISL